MNMSRPLRERARRGNRRAPNIVGNDVRAVVRGRRGKRYNRIASAKISSLCDGSRAGNHRRLGIIDCDAEVWRGGLACRIRRRQVDRRCAASKAAAASRTGRHRDEPFQPRVIHRQLVHVNEVEPQIVMTTHGSRNVIRRIRQRRRINHRAARIAHGHVHRQLAAAIVAEHPFKRIPARGRNRCAGQIIAPAVGKQIIRLHHHAARIIRRRVEHKVAQQCTRLIRGRR